MNNELLLQAIAQLPENINEIDHDAIETGFDSLFSSIANIAQKASVDSHLVSNIDDLLAAIHAKIDGALTTFCNLGAIAKDLLAKGEVMIATVKQVWAIMVALLHALTPVAQIVSKLYPALSPLLQLLTSLPTVA